MDGRGEGAGKRGRAYPGDGEGADEEVGEDDDGEGDAAVVAEDPGDGAEGAVGGREGSAVDAFQAADDEQEQHHEEGADEERGPAPPFVEEEDGREGEDDVEDVLDRGRQERVGHAGGIHHVDDVIHPAQHHRSAGNRRGKAEQIV